MTAFLRMFCVLCLSLAPALGQAESRRIALVMGMSEYQALPSLENTTNDAKAMAAMLDRIGFDVTLSIDAGVAEVEQLLDDFAFRSEVADLALIYFAGHGIEVQGENFLIPVDAAVPSNLAVQRQSISRKRLLGAVDRARTKRIVIFDS